MTEGSAWKHEGPERRWSGPRLLGGGRLSREGCLRCRRAWRGPPRGGAATGTRAGAAAGHVVTL